MMEEKMMMNRNLVLYEEFVKYLIEQPALAESIPNGATLVFLPADEPELYAANLELIEQARHDHAQVAAIRVKELVPPTRSRLIEPRLEPLAT